ncbi:MAG: efflux RND transporter permease subunit [Roseitalea sp.]|jgi:multidrug efflux pump subunit AcrB|nr:efflux RND transporter permease subunit [Roseitalea sp.]MBO6722947.1 efflux RND transporter permease subunit [Roseitalea sp.]MBO6743587.1 efflux RND transporter permease subunit [Roseitalea sp.]
MHALTRLGLDHRRVTILVMALLVAFGAAIYSSFPKREDPAITVRTAIVVASNPGLTFVQLEELVARPLEETARAVPGVDEVRTRLTGGTAVLQVDIENAVPEQELKRVFDEIRDDMQAVRNDLPDGTRGPDVDTDFGDVAVASVAVTGPDFSLAQLEEAAEDLRDRFYALDAISAVTLHGHQEEHIWLELDRARLAGIGTTLEPVLAALGNQNVRMQAGSIVNDGFRIELRTTGDYRSVGDIGATLIDIPDVGLVRLGDLVKVRRGYAEPAEEPVFFNGMPAVLVSAEMYAGEDIVAVGETLRQRVAAFGNDLPVGMQAQFSTFQPGKVEVSVNGALVNMAQTCLAVLAVMLVFIGWKQAFVIAPIVPLAIAFAFIGMSIIGIELQQVSIAAIIISLGLLVDNGLVIVEDMDRRILEGADRTEAALAAGRQYARPLLVALTTTVAAFLPLFLLDGTEGQYGFSLGTVVALTLLGSYLSALYILPLLAVWLLPRPNAKSGDGPFRRIAAGYGRIIALCLKAPALVIAACIGLVVLAVSQFGNVSQQLFPLSERNQFLVYMDMPKGTDIARTENVALRLSGWLGDRGTNPEVTDHTLFVGFGGPRFVLTLDPADTDPASAFFVVNTDTFEGSARVMDRLDTELAGRFPEARFRLKRLAMGGREPGVDVEISGPDADVLLKAAYRVEAGFASAPGIVQNQNDWGEKVLIGSVEVAQDTVREYGLSSRTISESLEGFFDGRQVSVFRQGERMIPIVLRGDGAYRDGFDDLANAAIEANGRVLAIDQLARLVPELEFASLRRIDQRRTITISAISSELSAYDLLDHVRPALEALDLGPQYTIAIAGEVEQAGEVREKLGAGLPYAITVMLIALMVQFNSFRRVGLTFLTVPLVIVGVPLALIGFGQPMSFFGTLGLIALSGIIINNVVVLIDQIEIERETLGLDDAIVVAAQKRFRPILLTSLTTVLGLTPMAMAGGALWEPMATLMIGGLGIASILALFYVPALYRILFWRAARQPIADRGSATAGA